MNLRKKLKNDSELRALLVQSWMVVMGLFWLIRFWLVKAEAIWLLKLDVYKGEETASLVKVSLGRDGIISGFMAAWLLVIYGSLIVRYRKKKRSIESKRIPNGQP